MRAKEFLTELGNSSYDYYEWDSSDWDQKVFRTNTGPDIKVRFDKDTFIHRGDMLSILFSVNGAYKVNGAGDAFKVFGTVMKVLTNELPALLDDDDIMYVSYTSLMEEESRMKLYERGIPLVTKILGPSWEFIGKVPMPNDDEYLAYVWKRKS